MLEYFRCNKTQITHDLSVLFQKNYNVQQTLRKNYILEIWCFTILILLLKKHFNQNNYSLYTPNVQYKIFEEIKLIDLSFSLYNTIKNLHSVLIYRIELLLSRVETFYWQKTNYLNKLKKLLSKLKSNYLLSFEKRGEDKTIHHLQKINQLMTGVIRNILQILNEKDPFLLKIFENGLLFVSSLNFNQNFSYKTFNSLLQPLGIVFDSKTLIHFPLHKKEFISLLFGNNKQNYIMSLGSGASNPLMPNSSNPWKNQTNCNSQSIENHKDGQNEIYKEPKKKIHKKIDSNKKMKNELLNLIEENYKDKFFNLNEDEYDIPEPPFLSPNKTNKRFSLVLDMDETMIHYPDDILLYQEEHNDNNYDKFIIRPYLNEFLIEIAKDYEIIIFTSASKNYADFILNKLEGLFSKYI